MILEVAFLNVIPERISEFEAAFESAQKIISSMHGYLGHQLHQNLEVPNRYILMVNGKISKTIRRIQKISDYQKWKNLLHPFIHPSRM
jgi:hypothetical protein